MVINSPYRGPKNKRIKLIDLKPKFQPLQSHTRMRSRHWNLSSMSSRSRGSASTSRSLIWQPHSNRRNRRWSHRALRSNSWRMVYVLTRIKSKRWSLRSTVWPVISRPKMRQSRPSANKYQSFKCKLLITASSQSLKRIALNNYPPICKFKGLLMRTTTWMPSYRANRKRLKTSRHLFNSIKTLKIWTTRKSSIRMLSSQSKS